MINRYISEKCIVLKQFDVNESDAVLSFYGESLGKFAALAKGIKKNKSKLAAQLQIGKNVEINILKNINGYLVLSCTSLSRLNKDNKQQFESVLTSIYICDLVDSYASEEINVLSLYNNLVNFLSELNQNNFLEIRLLFEWYFLSVLGYGSTDEDNLIYCFQKLWSTKHFTAFQSSVIDEVASFLRIKSVGAYKIKNNIFLSLEGKRILHDILFEEYQNNLYKTLNSRKILDDATKQLLWLTEERKKV